MAERDPIIVNTILDMNTLKCPLCPYKTKVPDVPVSDALGDIFGMSGRTLAMVHAEGIAKRVSREMRTHLESHSVDDWLPVVAQWQAHQRHDKSRFLDADV